MKNKWKITCAICGEVIIVPRDSARSDYELISRYGLGAVLERYHRTRHVLAHIASGESATSCNGPVTSPAGEMITQY